MAQIKTKTSKTIEAKGLKNRIAIILDRSSSMGSIREEAESVFNEQVKAIKAGAKDMETTVSLMTFSTTVDEPLIWNQPVAELKPLKKGSYQPNGMTALYDAVGLTVSKLASLADADDPKTSFLVVIISDGMENNSREFSASSISSKIKELQSTDRWTFTYLGANQDLAKVSGDLGIPIGNFQGFVATSEGTDSVGTLSNSATANYLNMRSVGVTSSNAVYSSVSADQNLDGKTEILSVKTDTETKVTKDSDPKA